jgi:hypothetical protein
MPGTYDPRAQAKWQEKKENKEQEVKIESKIYL